MCYMVWVLVYFHIFIVLIWVSSLYIIGRNNLV